MKPWMKLLMGLNSLLLEGNMSNFFKELLADKRQIIYSLFRQRPENT